VYELAVEKLETMRTDIRALKRTEKYLQAVLSDWQERMAGAAPGQNAHLLYSLGQAVRRSDGQKNRFRKKERR